jgi:hypothetical protein
MRTPNPLDQTEVHQRQHSNQSGEPAIVDADWIRRRWIGNYCPRVTTALILIKCRGELDCTRGGATSLTASHRARI